MTLRKYFLKVTPLSGVPLHPPPRNALDGLLGALETKPAPVNSRGSRYIPGPLPSNDGNVSLNLHRRHLTKPQLVELAMRLWPEVESRQGVTSPENSGEVGRAEKVAEMLGGAVSARLIETGKAVAERAPE